MADDLNAPLLAPPKSNGYGSQTVVEPSNVRNRRVHRKHDPRITKESREINSYDFDHYDSAVNIIKLREKTEGGFKRVAFYRWLFNVAIGESALCCSRHILTGGQGSSRHLRRYSFRISQSV